MNENSINNDCLVNNPRVSGKLTGNFTDAIVTNQYINNNRHYFSYPNSSLSRETKTFEKHLIIPESPFTNDIEHSMNVIVNKMKSVAERNKESLESLMGKYFNENGIANVELFKAFLLSKLDLSEIEINKVISYFRVNKQNPIINKNDLNNIENQTYIRESGHFKNNSIGGTNESLKMSRGYSNNKLFNSSDQIEQGVYNNDRYNKNNIGVSDSIDFMKLINYAKSAPKIEDKP